MLRIEGTMYLLGALLLLVLPVPWVLAAVLAALIHELCHLGALWLLGGKLSGIRLMPGAAVMEGSLSGRLRSILAALAGPAGSLLLLLFAEKLPRTAVCGCIQGLYNLLPIYPLDGGRVLRYCLEALCPKKADRVQDLAETGTAFLLILAAVWAAVGLSQGFWPVLAALFPVSHRIRRKIPCKQRQMRVQ